MDSSKSSVCERGDREEKEEEKEECCKAKREVQDVLRQEKEEVVFT